MSKPRPMFSTRHYARIASILGHAMMDPSIRKTAGGCGERACASVTAEQQEIIVGQIVERFIDEFEKDNPRFNARIFMDEVHN